MKLSPEEFYVVFQKLPYPIKEFLSSPNFGDMIDELQVKHKLHVDTTGTLAEGVTQMIAGIISPTQFLQELRGAGVSDVVANNLLQDLNTRVFKPLNEKIREDGFVVPTTSESRPEQPQARPAPQTLRATQPLQTSPPNPPVPLPPTPAVSVAPQPVPPQPKPIPSPVAQPTPRPIAAPAMRTMAHDVEGMKEGKVPPPFFANPVPPAAPVSVPPPAPRPVPPVFPTTPPPPREVPSLTPTAEEVSSSLKKYGIDPYREAVE